MNLNDRPAAKTNKRLIRTEASARISELMGELVWLNKTVLHIGELHDRLKRRIGLLEARIEAERQSI